MLSNRKGTYHQQDESIVEAVSRSEKNYKSRSENHQLKRSENRKQYRQQQTELYTTHYYYKCINSPGYKSKLDYVYWFGNISIMSTTPSKSEINVFTNHRQNGFFNEVIINHVSICNSEIKMLNKQ